MYRQKKVILILFVLLVFGCCTKSALAQESPSVLYVPLIGITSVPDPLALPNGEGNVTYNYAVKNFLPEVPLAHVQVVDDTCAPAKFLNGDDNGNGLLDYSETWRYSCTTKLSHTTESIAKATATANNITAKHTAYATVVVGSNTPPPLVSVVNITKVAYPLSLPRNGGRITYTYKVNNPGIVPLSNVAVIDDKCDALSGKLGDTNGNNLLDINEVWIYTCTTTLSQTTTNTVNVTAFANGLKAVSDDTITVNVAGTQIARAAPRFPNVGTKPETAATLSVKIFVWSLLSLITVILFVIFILIRKRKVDKALKKLASQYVGKKR